MYACVYVYFKCSWVVKMKALPRNSGKREEKSVVFPQEKEETAADDSSWYGDASPKRNLLRTLSLPPFYPRPLCSINSSYTLVNHLIWYFTFGGNWSFVLLFVVSNMRVCSFLFRPSSIELTMGFMWHMIWIVSLFGG